MTFTQALTLFMLLVVYGAHGEESAGAALPPKPYQYDDDPDHFNEQKIKDAAQVTETWHVTKRNTPATGYKCHSATKVAFDGRNYTYLFSVQNATTEVYIKWNVTMTPEATVPHEEANAVLYYYLNRDMYPEAPKLLSKLMTYSPDEKCAVLVTTVNTDDGPFRTCMIVKTNPTLEQQTPPKCKSVYDEYCPHIPVITEDTPWDPSCQ
ncbi:hypothetical protein MTO96_019365 [Rhipicephalus appendiculatus]